MHIYIWWYRNDITLQKAKGCSPRCGRDWRFLSEFDCSCRVKVTSGIENSVKFQIKDSVLLKDKLRYTKILKSLFEQSLIQIRQHQTESDYEHTRTGTGRGFYGVDAEAKQGNSFDWLLLKQLPYMGKPIGCLFITDWLFLSFIFSYTAALTLA